jgi:outer membrane lipoprotein
MKKLVFLLLSLILFACAPVLNRELMKEGDRNVPLDQLRGNPEAYKGRLYILGGVIVDSRFIQSGSQLEVLYLPVDSSGYLTGTDRSRGRFLAVYPSEKGLLDPMVYKKGREVTLAGSFVEARKSKIDDMDYVYPVFEIREVHLWEEQRDYYAYPYYPYSYYVNPYPYWYNPYWGPWPPPPGWW